MAEVATALVALCALAASAGGAQPRNDALPTVTDETNRIRFRLPGEWWQHYNRQELADRLQGGCGAGQLPEELLHAAGHKDAPAQILLFRGPAQFLMRDRDDLETFVNASMQALTEQMGGAEGVHENDYVQDAPGGMIVHRYSFSAPLRGGGGCAGMAQGQELTLRYLYVDYFVRPEGQDARNFQMRCFAPEEVWPDIKTEIEFVVSSLRYTGEVAGEFFVPDAPQEKVLSAEEVSESVEGRSPFPTWLLVAGLIFVVWLLMRRKSKGEA
ncbi:MAG: hypothetical protein R6V05_00565 [Candidatus Brocadiia bacterium]